MTQSMQLKLWTQRNLWKQRKRGSQNHSHLSDNFSADEDGDEEEADTAESVEAMRFRRLHRPERVVPNQNDTSHLAYHPKFVESDDEENMANLDDVDVNLLLPTMKFNVLHHRHLSAKGANLQLPHRHQTLKSQKSKYSAEEKLHTRGSFVFAKRNTMWNHYLHPAVKGNGWIRYLFLFGIATYFLIIFIQSQILRQQGRTTPGLYPRSLMFIPGDTNESRSKSSMMLSGNERDRIIRDIIERSKERKRRTTPPEPPLLYSIASYDLHSLEDEEEPVVDSVRSEAQRPANIGELCGSYAQKSALASPYSYLSRDALNSNARVLITGILSPIGFHLALALKERCGVQSIIGIDTMFPNTLKNRLDLIDQIKILGINIPQLVQPITIPLMGLDPRLKKRDMLGSITLLNSTGELNLLSFRPTHIVHLAAYSPETFTSESLSNEWRNIYSPYVTTDNNPPLYFLQSNAVAMEQILASLATAETSERPHFTYGSVAQGEPGSYNRFDACSKQIDDILVDTYHSLSGTFAVGLRLPTIYGPWARAGNVVHDLAESLAVYRNSTFGANIVDATYGSRPLDLLYVDDVVDATIAAMQFRSESSSPVRLNVSSGSTVSRVALQKMILSLVRHDGDTSAPLPPEAVRSPLSIQKYIQWRPQTAIRDGLLKTIAWHLDRNQPFGISLTNGSSLMTGDQFLAMHGAPTCAAEDIQCHAGYSYLPCVSECASKSNCSPSIFSDIVETAQDVSAGCDIVMYTQSLGRDVEDLKLHVQYTDGSSPQICNLAFVPRNSKLVDSVIGKVPKEQLVKFGVEHKPGEESGDSVAQERKLDGLNGNLLYRGWILIWIRNAMTPLSPSDEAMLKIAPGRLFSKDVKSIVFVDQNFTVPPTAADISFLTDELYRAPLKQRYAYRTVANGKMKKKVKYSLAAETARKAAMLVSKLKVPQDSIESIPHDRKISVYEAAKLMRTEMGLVPETRESIQLQRQREFYERIPPFVNQHDLRSSLEPLYYFEMKHWIRSKWVVHDLLLEESRQLRCEWYQEHVLWGAELDQLSFAHVMAMVDLKRRMAHHEPDEHVKPPFIEHPELLELSDAHEWHALNTEQNHQLLNLGFKKIPDHLFDKDSNDGEDNDVAAQSSNEGSGSNEAPVVAVRILSEKVMAMSRAAWIHLKGRRLRPN